MSNDDGSSSSQNSFFVPMTKRQFEEELRNFVLNGSTPPRLIPWRVLRCRTTKQERKRLSGLGMAREHVDWETVTDIADADLIKLTIDPFRCIELELEKESMGLTVVVYSVNDDDVITKATKTGFRVVGYKQVRVNLEAFNKLLEWLKSKERIPTNKINVNGNVNNSILIVGNENEFTKQLKP